MSSTSALVREHFELETRLWKEIYESDTVEAAVYQSRQDKVLALLDSLSLASDARILELGCGAGWNVAAVAERGFRVTAVDLVPRMLYATCELASARRVSNRVTPLAADAQTLPFPDASFDLVIGIALLEWLSTPALFAEIARVLPAGAHALLTATNPWSLQRCLDPYLNPAMEPLKSALRRRDHAHSRTHSLSGLDACFAAAGLAREQACTAGFGPFTICKHKLLPGRRGAALHRMLSNRSSLKRAGYAHIVLARKSGPSNTEEIRRISD